MKVPDGATTHSAATSFTIIADRLGDSKFTYKYKTTATGITIKASYKNAAQSSLVSTTVPTAIVMHKTRAQLASLLTLEQALSAEQTRVNGMTITAATIGSTTDATLTSSIASTLGVPGLFQRLFKTRREIIAYLKSIG